MNEVRTELLFEISMQLAAPIDIGAGPVGRRLVVMVGNGEFNGPKMSGTVIPLTGADWARVSSDGVVSLDVRIVLQTSDGANIYMTYGGRLVASSGEHLTDILDYQRDDPVDPASYYMRTNPLFETGDPRYDWLNGTLAIGIGKLGHGGVSYKVYAVH